MKIRVALILPAVLIVIILIGLACSGGSGGPLTPSVEDAVTGDRVSADVTVGGLWQITLDKSTGEANVLELRQADQALNALGLIENTHMFGVHVDPATLEINPTTGYVVADIILEHPGFSDNGRFNIFDVKGLVFGPRLANADGYTPLLRPSDFMSVPFGYLGGKMGTPDRYADYNDSDYPYKYFADGLTKTDILPNFFSDPTRLMQRGIFTERSRNSRRYELYFDQQPGEVLVFNYAVLVNYDFPTGKAPFTLGDFPIWTANAAEPFYVYPKLIHNGLYSDPDIGIGGTVSVDVEVYDWQGLGDVMVTFEVPGVTTSQTLTEYTPGSTVKSGIFSFQDIEGTPQQSGVFEAIIIAADKGTTFGASFFQNLLPSDHVLYNEPAYTMAKLELNVIDAPIHLVAPIVGPVIVGENEINTYSVNVMSPINPNGPFVYEWEKGSQQVPQYDDGDGGNDGTIDLSWNKYGQYRVDCRVTDPSGAVGTSIQPLVVSVVERPASVGDLTLVVNRMSDNSVKRVDNVALSWNSIILAREYAVYADTTPMNGTLDCTEYIGATINTWIEVTVDIDGAAYFEVRARALVGEAESEGPASDGAFVDFEQAEFPGSEGSWEGNSFYDHRELAVRRSSYYAHHLGGGYGWYNNIGSATAYHDSYEVFYSQPYPEIPNADTFLFEVAHRVYGYNEATDSEDGYAMGFLANNNPIPRTSSSTNNDFVILGPIQGDPLRVANDAMTDEFTYANNPDAGYTGTNSWRLSTFSVHVLAGALFDRVAIGHATDTQTAAGAFVAFDDIAVIIH